MAGTTETKSFKWQVQSETKSCKWQVWINGCIRQQIPVTKTTNSCNGNYKSLDERRFLQIRKPNGYNKILAGGS